MPVADRTVLIAKVAPGNIFHHIGTAHIALLPSLLICGATFVYLMGVRRANHLDPGAGWSSMRTAAFLAAMVVTFVAIQTVVGAYDGVLFWDHMVQHLLLVMVAGALIAMGCPMELLHRATTGRARTAIDKLFHSPFASFFDHPLVSYLLYALFIPLVHLTQLYNLTLTNDFAHDAEHLAFLVVGYLFWRPVVGIEATRHRLSPGLRMGYLLAAVPVDTFTGLALYSTNYEMFPYYSTFRRNWGPSRVQDLHFGGAAMWLGGDLPMALGLIFMGFAWARYDEERQRRIDAELDARRETTSHLSSSPPASPARIRANALPQRGNWSSRHTSTMLQAKFACTGFGRFVSIMIS